MCSAFGPGHTLFCDGKSFPGTEKLSLWVAFCFFLQRLQQRVFLQSAHRKADAIFHRYIVAVLVFMGLTAISTETQGFKLLTDKCFPDIL